MEGRDNVRAVFRLSKGFTVPRLVELAGVPRRTIQEIERRGACTVTVAIKLADALGVTLDELCRDITAAD